MTEQKCTIFAKKADYAAAMETIKEFATNVKLEGDENFWQKAELSSATGKLVVHTKVREKPGDEFSGMILGLDNYARNSKAEQATKEAKENASSFISHVNIALGVIAQPEFTETDERLDIVFELAKNLDGLVYNGDELFDYNGETVIEFTKL